MSADHVTHEAVPTVEATVKRSGPVDRPRVAAGDADGLAAGEVVRLVLDGHEYRTAPAETSDGLALTGAYDTPAAARDPGGATDRLREWLDDRGLDYGRTVHLDVVSPGFRYGLRAPGERATYEDYAGPNDSLASIAESVERKE